MRLTWRHDNNRALGANLLALLAGDAGIWLRQHRYAKELSIAGDLQTVKGADIYTELTAGAGNRIHHRLGPILPFGNAGLVDAVFIGDAKHRANAHARITVDAKVRIDYV